MTTEMTTPAVKAGAKRAKVGMFLIDYREAVKGPTQTFLLRGVSTIKFYLFFVGSFGDDVCHCSQEIQSATALKPTMNRPALLR
jgi:hypothetical protein